MMRGNSTRFVRTRASLLMQCRSISGKGQPQRHHGRLCCCTRQASGAVGCCLLTCLLTCLLVPVYLKEQRANKRFRESMPLWKSSRRLPRSVDAFTTAFVSPCGVYCSSSSSCENDNQNAESEEPCFSVVPCELQCCEYHHHRQQQQQPQPPLYPKYHPEEDEENVEHEPVIPSCNRTDSKIRSYIPELLPLQALHSSGFGRADGVDRRNNEPHSRPTTSNKHSSTRTCRKRPRLSTLTCGLLFLAATFSRLVPATAFGALPQCNSPTGSRSLASLTTLHAAPPQPSEGKNSNNKNNNNKNDGTHSRRERRIPRRRAAEQQESRQYNATTTPFAMEDRLTVLEEMAARQAVELKRLQDENKRLHTAVEAFGAVVDALREAGLMSRQPNNGDNNSNDRGFSAPPKIETVQRLEDDPEIFGKAPSSVMDAADAAGAAVLAGLLAGQRRLLVDVRDAELTNPETLVQFIELAVLPVAAGLEGLRSKRNRLKIVFPKVSQLLEYRKTMALAAPEVVALSTMDFDPVEAHDNLVVLLAPHPDDSEGVAAMQALLDPKSGITQPVVVLNPHMAPISGPALDFEMAYQLRLYTVHYTAHPPPKNRQSQEQPPTDDDQLEAAMQHAKELSRGDYYGGTTRAMVIRAYPHPWNVFVDTSPDTDADFVVAGTFAAEPTADDVNMAIIECLQGSEEEDELVAQQMQQALESGQLDRVSELLGNLGLDIFDEDNDDDEEDDDDDDDDPWNLEDVDTV